MSSSATHPDLLSKVDEHELPELYGGVCRCKATCVYSEKGPWSEVENRLNYQKPNECSDESDEEFKDGDFTSMLRDDDENLEALKH